MLEYHPQRKARNHASARRDLAARWIAMSPSRSRTWS